MMVQKQYKVYDEADNRSYRAMKSDMMVEGNVLSKNEGIDTGSVRFMELNDYSGRLELLPLVTGKPNFL